MLAPINFGCAVAFMACAWASTVQADAQPLQVGVALELNNADIVGEACRLTFVVTNGTEGNIEQAIYETVLFSKDGQVALLTLFDFGALPMGVPRVRQFQIPDTGCGMLSSVLVNGVNTCKVANQDSELCEVGLITSSRTDIALQG